MYRLNKAEMYVPSVTTPTDLPDFLSQYIQIILLVELDGLVSFFSQSNYVIMKDKSSIVILRIIVFFLKFLIFVILYLKYF